MNDAKGQTQPPRGEGIPIGGVGTGAVEFGRDGRFRAITVNNNRGAGEEIPVSRAGFFAMRVADRGKVYARILQTGGELPFAEAGMTAPYLAPEQLVWRSLYPTASYAVEDDRCPLKATWSVFSPVIPYDSRSACLPLILISATFSNPGSHYLDVAACVNWENLNGCSGGREEAERGRIRPVALRLDGTPAEHDEDGPAGPDMASPPLPAGLLFGNGEAPADSVHGSYCLVVKQIEDATASLMTWNDRDPRALEAFWSAFYEQGRLANVTSRDPRAYSGAVCVSGAAPPGEQRTFLFALTWHFPRCEAAGRDVGHAYAANTTGAARTAEAGLKYGRYFQKAVADWHGRFLRSSLPRWFSRMLINSSHVLTSHSVCVRDGGFALFESAEHPETGALDHYLYSSLAPLLFYPEMAQRELVALAGGHEPGAGPQRSLGRFCLHSPTPLASPGELTALGPSLALAAYRDYCMTGRMLTLVNVFPAVRRIMHALLKLAGDGVLPRADGQPLLAGRTSVNGLCSQTAGLWAASLRAYVRMARKLHKTAEAERFAPLAEAAPAALDAALWDEARGQYRFCSGGDNPESFGSACHTGQLAGEWASRFLGLGPLLPVEHVKRAMETITRTNCDEKGVAELRGPLPERRPALEEDESLSALHPAYYGALQIMLGETDRGLFTLKQAYTDRHVKADRPYCQPLAWDLAGDRPASGCSPRHVAASAVWHAYHALLGLHLDMAEQTLHLCPSLPKNVHSLNAPLFTPVCFGWLQFEEDPGNPYRQRVRVSFDSPVVVQRIVLRAPGGVEAVRVNTDAGEKVAGAVHILTEDRPGVRLVTLEAANPIEIGSGLTISLRQIPKRAPAGSG